MGSQNLGIVLSLTKMEFIMTVMRSDEYLVNVFHELLNLPKETEWVEFKQNASKPEEIGHWSGITERCANVSGAGYSRVSGECSDSSRFPCKGNLPHSRNLF